MVTSPESTMLAQVDALKLAMRDGLISEEEAIRLLFEWRQGGLTLLGADTLLAGGGRD